MINSTTLTSEAKNARAISLMQNGLYHDAIDTLREILIELRDLSPSNLCSYPQTGLKDVIPSLPVESLETASIDDFDLVNPDTGVEGPIYHRAFFICVKEESSVDSLVVPTLFNLGLALHCLAMKGRNWIMFKKALDVYESCRLVAANLNTEEALQVAPVFAATLFNQYWICCEFFVRQDAFRLRDDLLTLIRLPDVIVDPLDRYFYCTTMFLSETVTYRNAAAA